MRVLAGKLRRPVELRWGSLEKASGSAGVVDRRHRRHDAPRAGAGGLPSELLLSVWRTVLYGWCSAARYAPPVKACRFRGALQSGWQQHYLARPFRRGWLERFDVRHATHDTYHIQLQRVRICNPCHVWHTCAISILRLGNNYGWLETARMDAALETITARVDAALARLCAIGKQLQDASVGGFRGLGASPCCWCCCGFFRGPSRGGS